MILSLFQVVMNITMSQPIHAPFRLAVVQMYVEPGNLQKNLEHASRLIAEASVNGADMVLLPEVMDVGWTHPSALRFADSVPGGRTCNRICQAARDNNVYVCCGMVERSGEAVYNTA